MRKITQNSVNAFRNRQNFSQSNMRVEVDSNEVRMYLHNNLIAKRNSNGLFITSAGWQSNTTKERLNGLIHDNLSGAKLIDSGIYQKDFVWYLNGKAWNGKLTKIG